MKFATSNIALPAYDHTRELSQLREMGLEGIEIAPSRVWRDTWKGLTPAHVETYSNDIKKAGLQVVGLHSLFFDQPDLGLFHAEETRRKTLDFMVHLSALCRDLGGKTLIYGGGRMRGDVSEEDAYKRTIDFCGTLCDRIEAHGTCYCFEPLSPQKTDFIHSVNDSLRIVCAVDHPALRVQLDADALAASNEIVEETFQKARPYLVHMHANEPGFEVLGSSGKIDHAAIGAHLRAIGYSDFVSIEQRMLNEHDPLQDLATSVCVLKESYQ
ncbi:MAG: sugar phosphate isomerase/epimerase [Rhodospirillales bacterium]|nr:sugar phosphate isomerase/epimerase [Rhodospirillales bacterium]